MAVRLEHDTDRLLTFLAHNLYPYTWLKELLEDHCVRLRFDRHGKTVAYVWWHWDEHRAHHLACHLCVSPAARPFRMSAREWSHVRAMAALMGAKALIINIPSERLKPMSIALARRGWRVTGSTATYPV